MRLIANLEVNRQETGDKRLCNEAKLQEISVILFSPLSLVPCLERIVP